MPPWTHHFPEKKLFKETIVFLHHTGGSERTLKSHVEMVKSLGFEAITFNLSFHGFKRFKLDPKLIRVALDGVREIWVEELTRVLDAAPGSKILYSLSFPSAAALKVIADRNARNIPAWICDGGPSLGLPRSYWNYFSVHTPIKNWLLRGSAVGASLVFFAGINYVRDMKRDAKKLPPQFPVLSIRGWQDPLVPAATIDAFFDLAPQIKLEKLALPEGHHLDGLKNHASEYVPRVRRFLETHAQKSF